MNTFSTRYLDVQSIKELVSKLGLISILKSMTEQLRTDFSRWDNFEKSPRTANHNPLGVIELMPISDRELYSFKFVNGHPKNPDIGIPTIMAFGALSSMSNGFPILLSEMTILTAIRTAATSVLAASLMARPESKTMAMIGNGAQSEFQILAFHHLLGIETFKLYDIDTNATNKLINNLSSFTDIQLIRTNSAGEAAKGSDIVTTCTADKKNAIILKKSDIESGMHLNAIGGDCPGKTELEASILNDSRVVVEYTPQSRIEGEIQLMDESFKVTELHEVINETAPGRINSAEITIFDSVGFSLEDFSALKLFNTLAEEHNIGTKINLVPQMSNVKDLYTCIKS